MAKAIQKYAGGIHARVQAAVREDGTIFKRWQRRTHRGYQWTAWQASGQCSPLYPPGTLRDGFATLFPVGTYDDFGCRLPRA